MKILTPLIAIAVIALSSTKVLPASAEKQVSPPAVGSSAGSSSQPASATGGALAVQEAFEAIKRLAGK